MHTLMLTGAGKVYSCGCNDHGQLGQTMSRKRPRMCHFSMYFTCVFAHPIRHRHTEKHALVHDHLT